MWQFLKKKKNNSIKKVLEVSQTHFIICQLY